MFQVVTRRGDMSPETRLRVWQQEDGDYILEVVPEYDEKFPKPSVSVEFCTCCGGGGNSPHTRKAITDLIDAIRKDNAERPSEYSGEGVL